MDNPGQFGGEDFPYLFRRSSEGGGGDVDNLADPQLAYAGRWAGDECYLVGDYDESKLYDRAKEDFTNISEALVEEYNTFIELDDLKLGRDRAP